MAETKYAASTAIVIIKPIIRTFIRTSLTPDMNACGLPNAKPLSATYFAYFSINFLAAFHRMSGCYAEYVDFLNTNFAN